MGGGSLNGLMFGTFIGRFRSDARINTTGYSS